MHQPVSTILLYPYRFYWLTESDMKLDSVPGVDIVLFRRIRKGSAWFLGSIGSSQDFHLRSAQPSDCSNWTHQHPMSSVYIETQ